MEKETVVTGHVRNLEKEDLFNKIKEWIQRSSYVLIPLFAWLQIKEIFIQNPPSFDDKYIQTLFRVIVALWYSSWVFGVNLDVNDERKVIIRVLNKGKLDFGLLGFIISFIVSFAVFGEVLDLTLLSKLLPNLIITPDIKIKCFVAALTIFHFLGRFAELHMSKIAKNTILENRKLYEFSNDYTGLLSLEAINNFFFKSNWLRKRFYVLTFIIMLINVITFTHLGVYVADKINKNLGNELPDALSFNSSILIVCFIVFYLTIAESWIWYKRIIRNVSLKILSEIKENSKYGVVLKQ